MPDDILDGKVVLVTGGTGSLGQVLVGRLVAGEAGRPRKIIVMSRDAARQHVMRQSYLRRRVTTDESIYRDFERTLEFRLGDVRDYRDVAACVRDCDVIVNAAALKQVPTCEYFPGQALETNCLGAMNIVRAVRAGGYRVDSVIGVSTDKACKPVNVMGMTKALQERIFVAANIGSEPEPPRTRFLCIRYGNVLASRGSVVPLFHDQIARGGPVTVTVAEMTRFLITLDDAVDLIFTALRSGRPGEVLVPIAPAATVMNVARALIGDRRIAVRISGIRPGEKVHEVLIADEESHRVRRDRDTYLIAPMLPELGHAPAAAVPAARPAEPCLKGEYSSADDVLDLPATAALLERNHLLPHQLGPPMPLTCSDRGT